MTQVFQYKRTEREQPTSTVSSTATRSSTTTTEQKYQDLSIRMSVEALRELYADCIGSPMPMAIHRRVLLAMQDGEPYEYYRYALNEAALAPRPSWRYVMAIVARLHREDVSPQDLLPWM